MPDPQDFAILAIGLVLATFVVVWAASLAEDVHRNRAADDAQTAADWDEPTRAEIEADWLFDDPAFIDTSIDAEMRREEDVWFAASVLADIDDLPEVRHG